MAAVLTKTAELGAANVQQEAAKARFKAADRQKDTALANTSTMLLEVPPLVLWRRLLLFMLPGWPSLLLRRAKKGAETVSSAPLADIFIVTTVTKYNSSIQSPPKKQKKHPHTGNLNSEPSGDSENAFLHCGDILAKRVDTSSCNKATA